jgi:hypothetical protein
MDSEVPEGGPPSAHNAAGAPVVTRVHCAHGAWAATATGDAAARRLRFRDSSTLDRRLYVALAQRTDALYCSKGVSGALRRFMGNGAISEAQRGADEPILAEIHAAVLDRATPQAWEHNTRAYYAPLPVARGTNPVDGGTGARDAWVPVRRLADWLRPQLAATTRYACTAAGGAGGAECTAVDQAPW